ncbi:MAG: hypothetical protein M3447_03260 [Acidobacteriota bacterium]|nr:hypothetical protein [Acidobacteriota bacterium]
MQIFSRLLGVLILANAAFSVAAQESSTHKQNARPESSAGAQTSRSATSLSSGVRFSYEFSQPQFYLRHIVIEHDASGHGRITFERLNEEVPIVESLQISPTALERISALWQGLRFLDSDINYQSDKQFPHLGTMKLTMTDGEKKRTAEFNWSNVKEAADLTREYRRIADQASFVFDVSVARENQPLNAPKLMEGFEAMLKRNALSDPQQMVPLLKEISSDERLPLIARNHALRLLSKINK